jgi:hypothetical protein
MTENHTVRLLGAKGPRTQTMRWVLALLCGLAVVCTLLAVSGCAETSCALARSTGYYCPKGLIGAQK